MCSSDLPRTTPYSRPGRVLFAALVAANLWPQWYDYWWGAGHEASHWEFPGHFTLFGHHLTLHFLVNDIFMVFFFGIAAKEITESLLPGGSLNPIGKAINPLLATLGGVIGPVAVFFGALYLAHGAGLFPEEASFGVLKKGWGIQIGRAHV